jgi:glutamate-ammonia-ligase adenylyltransferase
MTDDEARRTHPREPENRSTCLLVNLLQVGRAPDDFVWLHEHGFSEPARAAVALRAIARQLPDPLRSLCFVETLLEPLSRCADPDMALSNLARWASLLTSAPVTFAALEEDPHLLDDLLCLFASSQYLSEILIREPTAYTLLLEPTETWRNEDLSSRLAALVAPFTRPESRLEALRRFRRRQFLRIGWRDLTGRTEFTEIVAKISELADALIEQALLTVRASLADRYPDIDSQVQFAVVALGKLGGQELNYSSDVDLLFLFDSPNPDDPAVLRYSTRLAEALFAALNSTTAEGRLFQVDMRLRPEGRSGALVRSLASYREYYDRWMETWERQALIKARAVAGNAALGRRFMALAEERAYPSIHAATLFEDVRDMRSAIERRVEARDQGDTNVKEGRGTIREIEFTVQLLQLLFGAKRPELRTGNTLEALAALERAGLLTADEKARFTEHYIFFRTVEHRLQIMNDLPVRLLPSQVEEQNRLARRMGCTPAEAVGFMDGYRARANEVADLSRAILDRLTTDGIAAADPLRLMILDLAAPPGSGSDERIAHTQQRGTDPQAEYPRSGWMARLVERLAADGFRQPGVAAERLKSLATGAPRFSLPISTTRLFADMAGPLLATAAAAPDPDGALAAVAEVAERLGTHRTLYQTLRSQPDMLQVLCSVVGFSPVVREMVLRSPELLDVLYDEPFREAPRTMAEMHDEMASRLSRAFSPADRLSALRRFQKRELLRTVGRDLLLPVDRPRASRPRPRSGWVDVEATVRELADLAEICVNGVLTAIRMGEQADQNITPAPFPEGFAVLALGRFGGRELHYLSDLDLLYVYEPPAGSGLTHRHYEALAAALTRGLQEWQREGRLYEVDLRLRPEGKSGYMAVHLDAARRYYLEGRAQTWERQALTKARPIAGDLDLAGRFLEAVEPFVYGQRLPSKAEAELRAMKRRIETERVTLEERDWHLKLGPGGLSDIEFIVQHLQLAHGADHPDLRVPGTFGALRAATRLGLLPEEAWNDLLAGLAFLTQVRQRLRLRSSGTPTDLLPRDLTEQEILARSLGLVDGTVLLERYRAISVGVRESFQIHFLSQNLH